MPVDVYLSSEEIESRLNELAKEINKDYAEKEILAVGILNGSFIFMADLVRRIKVPIKIDFIRAKSYEGTQSSAQVKIDLDLKSEITDRHVLMIEDIIDTGLTLTKIKERLMSKKPASLKIASLLYKPARALHAINIDYLGFKIEDHFVIGYGLDYEGKYRELPM